MGRTLGCVLATLLMVCTGAVAPVLAAEGTPVRALRSTAKAAMDLVERISARADEPNSAADVAKLLTYRETLSASHLLLSERLQSQGEALQGRDFQGAERHRAAVAHYQAVVSRVQAGFDRIAATGRVDRGELDELRAGLTELASPRSPAIHGMLPYRQPAFPAQSPRITPAIIPAYCMMTVIPAAAVDLAGSPEAPISAAITEQAKAIAAAAGRPHWDPAALYNWVRENIRTEWYWGSMKGAEETLRQRSGNDADQAALLIALLRAAGYPARYVRGVAEFFPGLDAARSATGIDDPEQILDFFRAAGIPCEAVREGAEIVNLRCEHIWVETLVPYANYRGMEADATGALWIPLDTMFKTGGFDEADALDLAALAGNPLPGFRDRYLTAARAETPLELLRGETDQFLLAAQPGHNYADCLHTRTQRLSSLGLLPSGLQFVEVAVTAEYAALPPELHHRVRLKAVAGDLAAPLFDTIVPLRELSNRPVMIGFEPETVADQERINRWGGLDNTPSYLVRLRPTVVVDGARWAVANSGLAPGGEFALQVEFQSPAGDFGVTDPVACGYPLLLGIVAQEAVPPAGEILPATAPELLHRSALAYIEAWNRGESELAALLDLAIARPLPTFVAVGGQLRVDELAGVPHAVSWEGLFVDANLRVTAVAPRRAGVDIGRRRDFFTLAALEGSVQEDRLFLSEFGVESISTARLIGLAGATGVPLLTLDAGNIGERLPALGLAATVSVDIADAVAAGQMVHIPAESISAAAWRGVGYLKENPVTGEAGYMLAGGLAGGQTVLGRRDWPAEIAAIMAQPFTGAPNDDPEQAFTLAGVTPWEIREATAGEPLAGSLMALVRDAKGTPVTGAPVSFRVRAGGGRLLDDLQPGVLLQELTVFSGRDGIARAGFVPGESTGANPVVYVREGDRHANLAGENLIDAQLASGSLASLATPIAILGFAGLPDPQQTAAYGDNLHGQVLGYSGDALLLLRDRFGNPVANHPVTFTTGTVEPAVGSACQDPPGLPDGQRNAQLIVDEACLQRLPVYGECDASAGTTAFSRTDGGARAGVVLGGIPFARYPVAAAFATRTAMGSAAWTHYSEALASCSGTAPPENRLILDYRERLDEAGRNVDARPAGQSAVVEVKSRLLAEGFSILPDAERLSCSPLPDLACKMVAGTGAFSSAAPDLVTIAGRPAARAASMAGSTALPYLYRADIILPAGLVEVPVAATAVRTMTRIVNSCGGCGTPEENVAVTVGPEQHSVPVWGVELQLPEAVTVLVDSRGVARNDLTVGFTILPSGYVANCAQVLLYRNGELWDTLPAGLSGSPTVVFPAGYAFDPAAAYELQVILNNPGEANEIRSRRIPLLSRTAAVDLVLDGLPAAVEDQVGGFILLNNDYDERDADPTVTLPDAATPEIVASDDELKRAWLQLDDSSGQGGSWQVRAGDPAKLRVYRQKDSAWVEFKPGDPPEPVNSFPTVIPLYLEGLAESTGVRGDTLTATFFPANAAAVSDAVPVTTIDFDLAVDGNRDRIIDFRNAADESALFWVNNDHDVQGTDDGQVVEDDAESGDDSTDAKISCKRDLEDFARLHIQIGRLGISGQLTYTLKMIADDDKVQPMLNVFPAVNRSDGYLGLPSPEATPEQPDEQETKPLIAAVSALPVKIPASELAVIGGNPFLFEGRRPGKGRLVLIANNQGVPLAERSVALELVDPVWFYDHFVVSPMSDAAIATVGETINPEGMAADASRLGLYRPATDEYVLYVHGWNMQPWEKKRWAETIVKRLWWQGYQGKVGLFDWPCNTFTLIPGPTNYDRSEYKAWQAAKALTGVLKALSAEHPGTIRLLAHSQGNVVAGEALRLGDPGLVHTYVASQAALSASFYEGNLANISPMLPAFTYETPEVIGAYPADQTPGPYLSPVKEKGARLISYFNVGDYALVNAGELTPGWEYNNRTRPDDSIGYHYDGTSASYPPVLSDRGFYRDFTTVDDITDYRLLSFPSNRYEIFSLAAESRSKALGAVNPPPVFEQTVSTFEDAGSRNLAANFDFNDLHYSHSRQFRSDVVAEQGYWRAFVKDAGLHTVWSY